MKNMFFLGITNNDEIAFCEIELDNPKYYQNGKYFYADNLRFSASFDTVRPFKGKDVNPVEYFEEFIDNMDSEWVLKKLKEYNCRPSGLARILAVETNDPRDYMDCSLFNEEYEINGDLWYFESMACGQHDLRKDGMKTYINKELFDEIMYLWDEYHLKEVNEEVVNRVNKIKQQLSEIDEEECIKSFIEEEFY